MRLQGTSHARGILRTIEMNNTEPQVAYSCSSVGRNWREPLKAKYGNGNPIVLAGSGELHGLSDAMDALGDLKLGHKLHSPATCPVDAQFFFHISRYG